MACVIDRLNGSGLPPLIRACLATPRPSSRNFSQGNMTFIQPPLY